ncbi:hypothetical protein GCM10011506_36040 [Marivirga lumbricoides]|uniref:DUF3892 domain-containing protein n=1 Tax=Marivirga lumbricoides TaxID=1046115 RepID=A0ABQ1N1T7_9BACT|nr:hypothetical protein GCM10011506_36040 [Marivirga lumbricoides]
MKRLEINCINKDERLSKTERITHVGGLDTYGDRWEKTVAEAIDEIEKGTSGFYVEVDREEVDVVVAKSSQGNKYLRTEADDYEPNNLLSLIECN